MQNLLKAKTLISTNNGLTMNALWKFSTDMYCFQDVCEITETKAKQLLNESGIISIFDIAIAQLASHRSGSIKTSNGYVHFMPRT